MLQSHGLQHATLPFASLAPKFAQTHVHWVGDAIHPFHPLLPPSPPTLNLSQHQGLFQWVGYLHQMAKVLELLHQTFQWIFRIDILQDWLVWFSCSPRERVAISQEPSPAPQFKTINSSALSLLYGPTLTFVRVYWENYSFDYTDLCQQGDVSALEYTMFVMWAFKVPQW